MLCKQTLDIDKITKIESRPISPPNFTREELLAQMNLKNFDKDEKIEKSETKFSRTEQRK